MRPRVFRFFAVLLRPRRSDLAIAVSILALGVYLELVYPGGFDQTIGITLFLQLFAASTGYRERLRRGHFDPVLVGRPSRWAISAAHWGMSIALGLTLWLLLGVIDLAGGTGHAHVPTALTPTGLVVFLYVSTVVWAVTLPLPRYSGAILWLSLLLGLGATQRLQALHQTFSPAGGSWSDVLHSTGAALVCPVFFMLEPSAVSLGLLGLVLLATLAIWIVGAMLVGRFAGVLVES